MTTWRCPHCRTVQVDASSCFLCNRSATSCGTCVNFRRSLVGGLGYCALDAVREPLTGEERRPCWTDQAAAPADGIFVQLAEPVRAARVERGLLELNPQPGTNNRASSPPISGR
jgi:hypothetical protein